MAFHEVRLPEPIAIGAEGGPSYVVDVVETLSGAEQRNLVVDRPRQRYSIGFLNRDEADMQVLSAFFRARKGRAHGFRFRDPFDYSTTIVTGVLTLIAGSPSDNYQCYKRYTDDDGYTEDRKIVKLVAGTLEVYRNGVSLAGSPTAYFVDYNSGVIVIPGGSGTLRWVGEFDVPVRFDTDLMRPSYVPIGGSQKLASWDSVELIELPL